jgi:hypothetical protein
MQKVVGSSPIIRSSSQPWKQGFFAVLNARHPIIEIATWQQNGNAQALLRRLGFVGIVLEGVAELEDALRKALQPAGRLRTPGVDQPDQ